MATSKIKSEQVALHKGDNTFDFCIASSYITGSGNYVNFFIPVQIPDGLTVSGVTLGSDSACKYNGNTISIVARPVTILGQNKLGVWCECSFSATQTANSVATCAISNFTITCS